MALRTHVLYSPGTFFPPRKIQTLPLPIPTQFSYTQKTKVPYCSNRNRTTSGTTGGGDAGVASELATEAAKLSTQLAQKEEAMDKSKQLLFSELCNHLGQEKEEVKAKWRQMGEEEKWVLVKGLVDNLGVHFQPLSARSAKELIEEYLQEEKKPALDDVSSASASASAFFPGLKRLIAGFTA